MLTPAARLSIGTVPVEPAARIDAFAAAALLSRDGMRAYATPG